MPPNNDPVQPIPFDVVQPAPIPTATPAEQPRDVQRGTPGWVLLALASLLIVAALVIFLLPKALEPRDAGPATPSTGDTAVQTPTTGNGKPGEPTAATSAPLKPEATPWSDAQLARLRKEAQDVLQELLDLQFALQEKGVEQWAPEAFADVAALATEGDTLYRDRDFEQATNRYKEGLASLQALQEAMPQRLQTLLEQARTALADGDQQAALAALTLAATIEPGNSDIALLQQRATVLPTLLPLLEQAATAEAAGDLEQAQTLLREATKLDPQHVAAKTDLERVATKLNQQRFNAAMSEGYAALSAGRFDSARSEFRNAAKLQQDSAEAASALREVESAATAQRLTSLEQQGRKEEQQEQWQNAVTAYEQAQKIDRGILFASEGLQRARARAQLDQQFRTTIAEPQRLSDAAVASAAAGLLAQAQQITPRGPVLEQQVRQLDTLLKQASAPVVVTLRSDQNTEVTVYKVAKLGRFAERELTLRPGTYTALGTRNGYRDVRQSFTLTHDSAPPPISIICTEPI